jgi:hypothetical protein
VSDAAPMGLADLPPDVLEAVVSATKGDANALVRLSMCRVFSLAAEAVARTRATESERDVVLRSGETWFKAMRFAELQAGGAKQHRVALNGGRSALALVARGFVVTGEPDSMMLNNYYAMDHRIEHVSMDIQSAVTAAVTASGTLLWHDGARAWHGGLAGAMTEVGGALSGLRVVSVTAGVSTTAVITEDGGLFTFGDGKNGSLGHGGASHGNLDQRCYERLPRRLLGALERERVVQVSAGGGHTVALTAAGTVFTFGVGADGQLGHGRSGHQELIPRRVEGALTNERVASCAAGSVFTAAVTTSGTVFTFGSGRYGQLGHGTYAGQHSPVRVEALAGRRVARVIAGNAFAAVLTEDGVVLTFGDNRYGQLGRVTSLDFDSLPDEVDLAVFQGVRAVSLVAGGHCMGVETSSDHLVTFGQGHLPWSVRPFPRVTSK